MSFTYPRTVEPAVRGMTFSVHQGEVFGFGPLRADGGRVALWDKDAAAWGRERYQRIGVSFELPKHHPALRVTPVPVTWCPACRALRSAMDSDAFWLHIKVGFADNTAVAMLLLRVLRRWFG